MFTNIGVQRTLRLFVTMGLLAHISGCLFHFLAVNEARKGLEKTWGAVDDLWELKDGKFK